MNPATATPNPDTPAAAMAAADVDAHANAILPTGELIVLGGHGFAVQPLKVRQVFPFLKLARPLFAALVARPSSPPPGLPLAAGGPDQGGNTPQDLGATVEAALGDVEWLLDVLEQQGPTVVDALAVGLEPDCSDAAKLAAMKAALEDLELVDLVVLAKHFIVVNVGFFAQRGLALPQGPLNLAPVAAAAASVGQAPASS